MTNSKKILIVEPSLDYTTAAKSCLLRSNPDYVISCVRDGAAAMKILKSETFHCVIMSLNLPDLCSLNVISWVKKNPETPVIATSNLMSNEMLIASAFKCGIYDYLPKKLLSTDKLAASVKNIFEAKDVKTKLNEALRARDVFLSICSHELKTPLTSMKIQSQVLKIKTARGNNTVEDLKKFLDEQCQQIDKLTRLINEMLDVSRVNVDRLSIETSPIFLNNLVSSCVNRMNPALTSAKCNVQLDIQNESIIGEWDGQRLEQVMDNLLSNIEKYAAGSDVKVTVKADSNFATISVKDNGPGIPEDAQSRIFNCFEQVDETIQGKKGLGLGLFLIKEIINKHKGTVNLFSKVGEGTEFVIRLPIQSQALKFESTLVFVKTTE